MRKSVKLLLIEDDEVDRLAFERFVRKEELPYLCAYAGSVEEGLRALRAAHFDIVLTDFHLGDGDALEILEQAAQMPVVVITGAGGEETAVRAMRSGAYDYLTKDIDRRYLKLVPVTVESACRHHADARRAQMLQQAVTYINDCIYLTDLTGKILFVNNTFCETYGYEREEILGQTDDVLWASGGRQDLFPFHSCAMDPEGEKGECRHRRSDGTELAVLLSRSMILDEDGRALATAGAARDISERKCWEDALRESEERYALAAAGANDGLWDWNLLHDRLYFSSRWLSTLGYEAQELPGDPAAWLELVHPEDREPLRAQIDAHLEGQTPFFENEHRIRTGTGDFRWVQTRGQAVRDPEGAAYRMAGSQRDITDRKQVEARLRHAAAHDSLTGLPNRSHFITRLEGALRRIRNNSVATFGVIFLDLDRFKVINDSLGHLAGDQVLRAIGERLAACPRPGDTIARLGGDEFAVLVESLQDVREMDRVAERIHAALARPFRLEGQELYTSASLGIVLADSGYQQAQDVLRDADLAMYRAKAEGRKRGVVFDPSMHARAVALLHLQNDLRRAVDRREFCLHYQPLVRLADGCLTGFEALVRWEHPERGLVPPDEFLPVAREVGLLRAIGSWVLHQACTQLEIWRRRYPETAGLAVSVNLDGEQLSGSELVEEIEGALASTGLPAENLHLEITEGMLIEQPEVAVRLLARLRQRGIALHIDDFGTGYSSLSQLHRLPVDAMKIDRSFIGRMGEQGDEREIVRTIVSLAHNLGLTVMAEGVETVHQLEALKSLGCEVAQGYFFARPQGAESIDTQLARGTWAFPGVSPPGRQATADEARTSSGAL